MPKGVRQGGRQKGTPNRATIARQEAIAKSGLTPLDYMLSVMRDKEQSAEIRLDAAKSAAPYVHPKLAAIEHTGKGGEPLLPQHFDATEVAKRVAFLLAQGVAAGAP